MKNNNGIFKGKTSEQITDLKDDVQDLKTDVRSFKSSTVRWLVLLTVITSITLLEKLPDILKNVIVKVVAGN